MCEDFDISYKYGVSSVAFFVNIFQKYNFLIEFLAFLWFYKLEVALGVPAGAFLSSKIALFEWNISNIVYFVPFRLASGTLPPSVKKSYQILRKI